MAGKLLTTMSRVMCPHGGQAILTTADRHLAAQVPSGAVLLETDVHSVVGCPFTVGVKYSPCVRIEWSAGSQAVAVGQTPALTMSSVGRCLNAEGAPQGVAVKQLTQGKAAAT
jgi:hypothetical protein